jgi:ADP-heptose:LPS heptosyltransferase
VLERIPWPAHGSTPESTARANAQIAAMRYDVALIASEEPEAFLLAAPIRERVGFTTDWARPLKTLWVRSRTTRTVSRSQRAGGEEAHEVQVMYRLGKGLVREPDPPSDRWRMRPALLAEPNTQVTDETNIIVQAGPKWLEAGVGAATLRAVLERLAPYARVVAAPGEARAVHELTGLAAQTFPTLRAWVEALSRADLVVSVDTGAAHVAGMLCARVVDVFPDDGFDAQVRRWRPWAAPYRAFRASEVSGGAGSAFIETILDGF